MHASNDEAEPAVGALRRPRFCYLVMCHDQPRQVERLVGRVRQLSPDAHVLVRHDRPDLGLQLPHGERVTEIVSDIEVVWGLWSQADAILELIRLAAARTDADWFVLLSGTDYPVRDLAAWEAEVAGSGDLALVSLFGSGRDRYRYRYRPAPWVSGVGRAARGPLRKILAILWFRLVEPLNLFRLLNHAQAGWLLGVRRGLPDDVVKHSTWTTLHRDAVHAVVTTYEDDAAREWFARSLCPDESIVGTAVVRSGLPWSDRATSFARFSSESAMHPETISPPLLDQARAERLPFVRKVASADVGVLDAADAMADAEVAGALLTLRREPPQPR